MGLCYNPKNMTFFFFFKGVRTRFNATLIEAAQVSISAGAPPGAAGLRRVQLPQHPSLGRAVPEAAGCNAREILSVTGFS